MRNSVLLLILLLAACGAPKPPLVISELEISRPMPGMQMSAGYFEITNNTDETTRITRVSSPQFEAVEVHETTVTDGISRMRELDALVIPARLVVGYLHELEPMDIHAWFEAYIGGQWYTFDPACPQSKGARIAIAHGRDATDVAIYNQYGPLLLPRDMQVSVEKMERVSS